jgi:hypothetical protein
MVMGYEYETGHYEYTDKDGYKRIGKWEQKYVGDRDFYSHSGPLNNRKKVGVVDFYEDEDEDEYVGAGPGRRECPNCLKYDLHSPLRAKWVKYGQPVPSDNDKFLECYQCSKVYPKHEIERQKKLKADTKQHKSDNEFEKGETIIQSIPSSSSPAGKTALERRGRERQNR